MTITDDLLFAWIDGELDAETAARVEAAVAADPALTAKADVHRRLGEQLRGAFAPIMAASVPERIGEAPTSLAAFREERAARRPTALPAWASIAATLVVGIAVGSVGTKQLGPVQGSAPVTVEGGKMIAASALNDALDAQLASTGAAEGAPRIGLTFRDSGGRICRSFSGAAGSSGLACRDGGDWAIQGLFNGAEGQGGDYRMAAGEDPALAAMIGERIKGDPFDASAEQAAKAGGWR